MWTLGLGPGVKESFLIKTLLVQHFAYGYVIAGHVILHGHFLKESRATLACLYRTSGRILHATTHRALSADSRHFTILIIRIP